MTTEPAPPGSRFRGRLVLVGLFAIFFVPIFLAWTLNVELPGWTPFGRTNHGNLVEPVARFETSQLSGPDGEAMSQTLLDGAWTLVYIEPYACRAECDRAVYRMRQSRYAMGKDMDRVRNLAIFQRRHAQEAAAKLRAFDPSLTILAADPAWLARPRPGAGEAEIYIVDPQGYLVMWYRAESDPGGLIKDLKRLLKISKIG